MIPRLARRSAALRSSACAVAALAAAALLACSPSEQVSAPAGQGRVLILGLDGMDHGIVQQMIAAGQLPQLARLAREGGGLRALQTTAPPQSPTAWSSFITGLEPGEHGIFDFIHRDPQTLQPFLSTTRTVPPGRLTLGPLAIPLGGGSVTLLRRGKPFWYYLTRSGVPATVIKIPAHFPPRDDGDARVLAGMGTPDLLGTYGVYSLLTSHPERHPRDLTGGRVVPLRQVSSDRYVTALEGPPHPFSSQDRPLSLPVEVGIDRQAAAAVIKLSGREQVLARGEWSPLIPVELEILGSAYTLPAMLRLLVKRIPGAGQPDDAELMIYASPLNADPMDPALPIASPPGFARELALSAGRYYTQGMPEDTKALAEGTLTPDEFLAQARLILRQRERLLEAALQRFERGLLFFYFSSSDQIAHMFYRAHDRGHPARQEDDARHEDVIRATYRELDAVVGRVRRRLRDRDLLLVMSDHGFGPASYHVALNDWLRQEGYLTPLTPPPRSPGLEQIDWSATRAYGLGLNGLYLNLAGRERHGSVPAARRDALLDELSRKLLALRHPGTGAAVVSSVLQPRRLYPGAAIALAPDLLVGYARGFKVSDLSALGGVGGPDDLLIEVNMGPWSGDHCGDRRLVPGILAASRPLRGGSASLVDLAPTVLRFFNTRVPPQLRGRDLLRRAAAATTPQDRGGPHGQGQD